jgi:organic hydroperoxide reductase OsmC/OhrA
METFKIKINWKKTSEDFAFDNYNRAHQITFSGNQLLNNSAAVTYNGDENMSNPEELLASAISSCHMLTFLAVASKSGFDVESYDDDAVAYLQTNEDKITSVTNVYLHPTIKFVGAKIPDADKIKSMHEKAHRNCFIANSVKCAVEVVY